MMQERSDTYVFKRMPYFFNLWIVQSHWRPNLLPYFSQASLWRTTCKISIYEPTILVKEKTLWKESIRSFYNDNRKCTKNRVLVTTILDCPIPLSNPVISLNVLLLVRHFFNWVYPSNTIGTFNRMPNHNGQSCCKKNKIGMAK